LCLAVAFTLRTVVVHLRDAPAVFVHAMVGVLRAGPAEAARVAAIAARLTTPLTVITHGRNALAVVVAHVVRVALGARRRKPPGLQRLRQSRSRSEQRDENVTSTTSSRKAMTSFMTSFA